MTPAFPRFLLDLRTGQHEPLRRRLLEPRLERFIGVIYRPETELLSHYSDASLPQQFDAFVWFDETSAVTPLGRSTRRGGSRHLSLRILSNAHGEDAFEPEERHCRGSIEAVGLEG